MTSPTVKDGSFTVTTVEVHAEGEPGRVILDAADLVHGDSMAERFAYCRDHLQWLRELVLHEPRGHPALCAVLLLPPVTTGADFGMVVLEQGGFTPMSGSNTMCAVAGAVASGLVTPTAPVVNVTIDTAVGTVTARADVRDGKVVAEQAKARLAHDQVYREIASRSAADQADIATSISSIHAALTDMAARLAAIERVLKEVE